MVLNMFPRPLRRPRRWILPSRPLDPPPVIIYVLSSARDEERLRQAHQAHVPIRNYRRSWVLRPLNAPPENALRLWVVVLVVCALCPLRVTDLGLAFCWLEPAADRLPDKYCIGIRSVNVPPAPRKLPR